MAGIDEGARQSIEAARVAAIEEGAKSAAGALLIAQAQLLNTIARLTFSEPKEALRLLVELFPADRLMPELTWLRDAVFFQAASHMRDQVTGEAAQLDRAALPDEQEAAPVAGSRVSLRELAERIGMDRSACRRYILRLGYAPQLMRTCDSGYQCALTVSQEEADAIAAARAADGYGPDEEKVKPPAAGTAEGFGVERD